MWKFLRFRNLFYHCLVLRSSFKVDEDAQNLIFLSQMIVKFSFDPLQGNTRCNKYKLQKLLTEIFFTRFSILPLQKEILSQGIPYLRVKNPIFVLLFALIGCYWLWFDPSLGLVGLVDQRMSDSNMCNNSSQRTYFSI